MLTNILIAVIGIVLILGGANYMTDGASALAKRLGVSDLVIGLTVVAFGTSAPELSISVISSISGNDGIAVGNIVGSNIFNILAIVGCVALVSPIKILKNVMNNEIPLVLLSSLVLLICANGTFLDGSTDAGIGRTDGLLMLLFFLIFLRYTLSIARKGHDKDGTPAISESAETPIRPMRPWLTWIYIIGGLAALIFGGELFVNGASGIARGLKVNEATIGLTIVAAGTSLPDLAASLAAALKHRAGLAIGNIIGSNIFNIFFVLGTAATISPLALGGVTETDLFVLLGSSLLFWIFGWFFKTRTITRWEGAVMLGCYAAYMIYLVITAQPSHG